MRSCLMKPRFLIGQASLLLFLALALLWPALYNGQPFFFHDTTAYVRGADAGFVKLTRHRTAWTWPDDQDTVSSGQVPDSRGATDTIDGQLASRLESLPRMNSLKEKVVMAGRSPYYGALLYLGEITGGFWASVFLQGLATL